MFTKKLKLENERLNRRIKTLENENLENNIKLREYYENTYNKRLEYEKAKYKVTFERKKEIMKLCKILEDYIKSELFYKNDFDIVSYINSLKLLLDYLKEKE